LLIENLGLDSDLDTDSLDPDTDSVNPDTPVFSLQLYNLLVRPFSTLSWCWQYPHWWSWWGWSCTVHLL